MSEHKTLSEELAEALGPSLALPEDGRQSAAALEIARGTGRLLFSHGLACIPEVPLANGRRADLVAISESGDLTIVEVKSCLADFRSDQKWHEYRDFCDHLYFSVSPVFPAEVLPEDAGLILADAYGGEIVRAAPRTPLSAARRKAMLIRIAKLGAARLQRASDPSLGM
jgi:hypothetical protein